jgi:hypothetical protein
MSHSTPVLVPLTPEAREAARRDTIALDHFPFRVGRESRLGVHHGALQVMERRKQAEDPSNDLYLLDTGKVLNISRQHFQIEQSTNGTYELVDRGSACGTIVGNQVLGGHDAGGRATLEDGNVIVVGTSASPYVYKFQLNQE